ncbi:hypothetical protein Taro_039547 [Colocasia esculenta]|uniref:Uncharacterized protein n=1 Tax=Colocasia esculenta TaxID=4460 RepID=A0A843WAX9_COLES|nr:hypothetical protein [Colocasia esculenta]
MFQGPWQYPQYPQCQQYPQYPQYQQMPAGGQQFAEMAVEEQPPPTPQAAPIQPEVPPVVRQQTPVAAAALEDRMALLERFLHLWPPTFSGDRDPNRAESWVHELERTFETMDCVDLDQWQWRELRPWRGSAAAVDWGLKEVFSIPAPLGQSRECFLFFFFRDKRCWPDLKVEEDVHCRSSSASSSSLSEDVVAFFASLSEFAPERACDLVVELSTALGYGRDGFPSRDQEFGSRWNATIVSVAMRSRRGARRVQETRACCGSHSRRDLIVAGSRVAFVFPCRDRQNRETSQQLPLRRTEETGPQ